MEAGCKPAPRATPTSPGSFGQLALRQHRPLGFVLPICRVESSDRAPPPRQRAPLVAVERLGANEHPLVKRLRGQEIAAHLPDAHHIDLRRRNGACHPEAFVAGLASGDGARQSRNLLGAGGVARGRAAQTMPQRVARGARLALRRLRAAACAPVAPARFPHCLADHDSSFLYYGCVNYVPVLF